MKRDNHLKICTAKKLHAKAVPSGGGAGGQLSPQRFDKVASSYKCHLCPIRNNRK